MQEWVVPLAAAIAGSIVGAGAAWWVQLRNDAKAEGRALQDKIHQLELRIVSLEAANHAYLLFGEQRFNPPGGQGLA